MLMLHYRGSGIFGAGTPIDEVLPLLPIHPFSIAARKAELAALEAKTAQEHEASNKERANVRRGRKRK